MGEKKTPKNADALIEEARRDETPAAPAAPEATTTREVRKLRFALDAPALGASVLDAFSTELLRAPKTNRSGAIKAVRALLSERAEFVRTANDGVLVPAPEVLIADLAALAYAPKIIRDEPPARTRLRDQVREQKDKRRS